MLTTRAPVGDPPRPGSARASMIFGDASGFRPPVEAEIDFEPSALSRPGVEAPILSCRAREATLTWIRGLSVHELRCTPEGCRQKRSAPLNLAGASPHTVAVDVGGRVLLVRLSEAEVPLSGSAQALVYRLAEAGALADAPESVLVAGAAHGGEGALYGPWVRPMGGGALVAFRVGDSLKALWIDAAGSVRPVSPGR